MITRSRGRVGAVGKVAARRHEERGEGVVSVAIAVLIIAFLGVALWLIFDALVDDVGDDIETQIEEIGD
ncbi:hypothetical protein ER308_11025 [Egibacter rhizosphaerae]|uniref:Uncharacterized protein n=1 Tax=Egibacter rhizosphaerae TaxID=1670831 RepID=A0A411YFT5_9ACTN|nr:hypothetical protein [Egibacter rhizosphaerae]QBI20039.1 hypothetical protein ER308_11025 [Egibacter rhizosphaerae]